MRCFFIIPLLFANFSFEKARFESPSVRKWMLYERFSPFYPNFIGIIGWSYSICVRFSRIGKQMWQPERAQNSFCFDIVNSLNFRVWDIHPPHRHLFNMFSRCFGWIFGFWTRVLLTSRFCIHKNEASIMSIILWVIEKFCTEHWGINFERLNIMRCSNFSTLRKTVKVVSAAFLIHCNFGRSFLYDGFKIDYRILS